MSSFPVIDEKRVFALSSAISSNLIRLRQSIDGLRQLHDQWKDSNASFINLIAQLTALKSSLGEMHDWINYAIQDMHPQLLSDLDVLMGSCEVLVRRLDRLIAQLEQPDQEHVDFALKMKLAVGSRSMRRLQNVAKRQTDAVHLLLAACKCHTTAQRKILLHKSRQIRKEDASSLSTLARTSRWDGQCIKALTSISRMIQWFRIVFYIKLLGRSGDHVPTEQDYADAAAAIRSQAIDRELEEDATWLRRETKIVLQGGENTGKELIMRQMKVLYAGGYPVEERLSYKGMVRQTVWQLMHAIIDLLKDTGVNLSDELNRDFAMLLHEFETVDIATNGPTPDGVRAVLNIWTSETFSTLYVRNFEIDFPPYASYFAREIERISAPDYIPSEADIVRLDYPSHNIKELRFNWDELDVHLFSMGRSFPHHFRNRWLHQFENATALIFTVDVSVYDRVLLEDPATSRLTLEFEAFYGFVMASLFANSSVILLLNNFTRFRNKLRHSPLEHFFPDYRPGVSTLINNSSNNSNPKDQEQQELAARQYILRRFKDMNKNKLSIYSFWVDLDMGDNAHLYAALKKTLGHIQMRRARSEVWSEEGRSAAEGSVGGARSPTIGSGGRKGSI
ncbi:uncharacterized protein EI97DRAFT_434951 [Westerdykella ornata]|uniref:Guanine nucleotide-binding protein-like protein alpha-3 subunit n=1 Tax=Westerdykella ornata TaxID=318751 RepID=A0A6A6JGH2_WESOR|nr:uncharacterized protein EI97DRAFT_434951 [Westerdykella ornata]KAF2274726.1 hypothetical protein EI97DRAFT_434951 [Westerdykella ornata]